MSDTKQFKKRRTSSLRMRKAESSVSPLPASQSAELPRLESESVRMERVEQIREYLRSRAFNVDDEFRRAIGMLIEAQFK
jgi:anti-sigma28 factor (negative regulator of flagellin synthesis)